MEVHAELFLRILVGAVLAGVIGWERDMHRRPAGFRTHLIVGMASAAFMTVSTHFVYFQHYHATDLVNVDTSRIAAAVVTGIGFLGGGAILRTGTSVQGMTTAAGLWLCAAIGLEAGAGMYPESMLVTGLGFVALTVLRRFEKDKATRLVQRLVQVSLGSEGGSAANLRQSLESIGVSVTHSRIEENLEKKRQALTMTIRSKQDADAEVLACLRAQPGVRRIRLQSVE